MKLYILLYVVIFQSIICQAQTNFLKPDLDDQFGKSSRINVIIPTDSTIHKLELLCEVWGFLKYYHPAIANGNYNWDYELFKIMPQILYTSDEDLNNVFVLWIDDLGVVDISNNYTLDSAIVKMYPDYDWINKLVSDNLSIKLNQIRHSKRNNSNFYVAFNEFPPPIFQNESAYSDMHYPDVGFRLLALFRYWNIIQYYYPYKYALDYSWYDVLLEFIPIFVNASNELGYHKAILSLIAKISDTHATFSSKVLEENFKGKYVLPFEITFIENRAVVTGFLEQPVEGHKLQIGDIIEEKDGIKISEHIKEKYPYVPASNDASKLREIAWDLLRSKDSVITLVFQHNRSLHEVKVTGISSERVNLHQRVENNKPCLVKIADEIAYLNPWSYRTDDISKIIEEIKDTKGLIIDLRYPFYEDPISLLNYLLAEPTTFAKMTRGSLKYPGLFTYIKDLKEIEVGEYNDQPYVGNLVLLNNEYTQSSAEFATMAFESVPNSLVIGSTTSGADGSISIVSLPGGIQTVITGSGVYYPNGEETQRIGIIPDIEVKPTIKGVSEGRDELIEKAIEFLKSNK